MLNIDLMILQAMKNKEQGKVRTYRAIKSEIQSFQTAKNAKSYDESAEISLLRKMCKQREDSMEQYLSAGREDLVNLEKEELSYIKELIPETPSEDKIKQWVVDNYSSISKKEMGIIIKKTKETFPSADGKIISDIIKSLIVC